MEKTVEQFIDQRLAHMWLHPRMWGDARELQSACLVLLELSNFMNGSHVREVIDAYAAITRQYFPKCPISIPLSDYLIGYANGPVMSEDEAAQTVMNIFLELRSSLKENRHVDQEKA